MAGMEEGERLEVLKRERVTIASKLGVERVWDWIWERYQEGDSPEQIAAEMSSRVGYVVEDVYVKKALIKIINARTGRCV